MQLIVASGGIIRFVSLVPDLVGPLLLSPTRYAPLAAMTYIFLPERLWMGGFQPPIHIATDARLNEACRRRRRAYQNTCWATGRAQSGKRQPIFSALTFNL